MADSGIVAYVGGGGSGEGFTLSDDETRRLLDIAVDEVGIAVDQAGIAGRHSGVSGVRAMGVEPRTADQMVAFARVAAVAGVEACQIYSLDPGHGHRPTMEEVRRYFDEVLSRCALPAVLSTHQSVGYRVPVDMIASLAGTYDTLIGINCSHADIGYLARIVDSVGDRLEICVGGPLQALTALGVGAHGFLSSEANLAPRLVAALVQAVTAGDLALAAERFGQLARLHDLVYARGGIRATKAVLDSLGLPGGQVRPPQIRDDDAVDEIVAACRAWGIAELEGW